MFSSNQTGGRQTNTNLQTQFQWFVNSVPMKLILLILFFAASLQAADIRVYFSPKGGCTEAVVDTLNKATNSVLVQAYSFTSVPIAKALVDAHKRGVNIRVILDKSNRTANYSSADFVQRAGITTYIDAKHSIAHNKIIVVDAKTILTGSFNFTKAAEDSNAENLLVIQDSKLAAEYAVNWHTHLKHSEKFQGKPNWTNYEASKRLRENDLPLVTGQ